MMSHRFVTVCVISVLICVVAVMSILISDSEREQVIAIRRAIPQLTTRIHASKTESLPYNNIHSLTDIP